MCQVITYKSSTQVHCRSVHPTTSQPNNHPSVQVAVPLLVHSMPPQRCISNGSKVKVANFKIQIVNTQFGATLGTQGLSVNQPMPDVVVGGFNICINLS